MQASGYYDKINQACCQVELMLKDVFAESSIETIELENVEIDENETSTEAIRNLLHLLDIVCNRKRLHSTLENGSPDQLELEIALNNVAYYSSADGSAVPHGILSGVLMVAN